MDNPGPSQAGYEETPFRAAVRDLLDLDWSTRDEDILAEIRQLKALSTE